MEKTVLSFEQILDSQIDSFLEEDASYEYYATPVKPTRYIKSEHLNQLKELFHLRRLKTEFKKGDQLILGLLERSLSAEDFAKVKKEKEGADAHFFEALANVDMEGPVIFQQLFGYSNETMLHIYASVHTLMQNKNFEDAYSLLVFLTLLAPHVPSYWIAEGLCLQELNRHQEAVASFEAASFLDRSNPAPLAYAIESDLILGDQTKFQESLELLKSLLETYQGEDKGVWVELMKNYAKRHV